MNRVMSFAYGPTARQPETKGVARRLGFWLALACAIAVVCTAMTLDASLTMEQRGAVFIQSGQFP